MLVEAGGEASSNDQNYDSQQRLWLWPLPAPFEFVIEWQDLGLALTASTLDGSAVVGAAAHALPFAV